MGLLRELLLAEVVQDVELLRDHLFRAENLIDLRMSEVIGWKIDRHLLRNDWLIFSTQGRSVWRCSRIKELWFVSGDLVLVPRKARIQGS